MTLSDLQLFGCLLLLAYAARRLFSSLLANIATARRGWYAVLLVLVAFFGVPFAIGMLGEDRSLSDFIHPGRVPWSITIGGIVLSLAVMVAAGSASYWHDQKLVLSPWLRWNSGLVGLAFGFGFHYWIQTRNPGLDGSLTKLWYGFFVPAIMVAVLVWAGVLLLQYASTPHRWVFVALLVIQLSLMAIDTNRGLDPAEFLTTCDMVCGSQNVGGHLHDLLHWLVERV